MQSPDPVVAQALRDLERQLKHDLAVAPLVPLPSVESGLRGPLSTLLRSAPALTLEKVIRDHMPGFRIKAGRVPQVRFARNGDSRAHEHRGVCGFWKATTAAGCKLGAECDFKHPLPPGCKI